MFNWLRKRLQEKDTVNITKSDLYLVMENTFEMFLDTVHFGTDEMLKSEREQGKLSDQELLHLILNFMNSNEMRHKHMKPIYNAYVKQIQLIFYLRKNLKK